MNDLAAATNELTEEVRKVNTKLLLRSRLVGGLIVVLTLALGASIYQTMQMRNTQQDQIRTRQQVLCPLYGVFLASYDLKSQPQEQRPRYEQAFAVIRQGAVVLECPKPR